MNKSVIHDPRSVSAKFLRKRRQSSGNVFYYLELPGLRPRQEVPLGGNHQQALASRETILLHHFQSLQQQPVCRATILNWYLQIKVLGSSEKSAAENARTIQQLRDFFSVVAHDSLSDDALRRAYQDWRGPKHSLRAKRELSFLTKVCSWYARTQQLHGVARFTAVTLPFNSV